jgi:hypothetical protein
VDAHAAGWWLIEPISIFERAAPGVVIRLVTESDIRKGCKPYRYCGITGRFLRQIKKKMRSIV